MTNTYADNKLMESHALRPYVRTANDSSGGGRGVRGKICMTAARWWWVPGDVMFSWTHLNANMLASILSQQLIKTENMLLLSN